MNNREEDEKKTGCLALVGMLVYLPFGFAMRGFVVSMLWSWFVVTSFGLPPLGIVPSIGLIAVVGAIHRGPMSSKESSAGDLIVFDVLVAAMTLLVGWVVHLCM